MSRKIVLFFLFVLPLHLQSKVITNKEAKSSLISTANIVSVAIVTNSASSITKKSPIKILAGAKIRKVHIRVDDVFTKDKNFVANLGNAFHVVTRGYIIQQMLLYKKNDIYRQDLIDESDRNLRKYSIYVVKQTTVVPVEGGKRVDVFVHIQDVWSLRVDIKAESAGGVTKVGLTFGERNFLGRNLSLEMKYNFDNFEDTWLQSFHHTHLFGTRLEFKEVLGIFNDTDGKRVGEVGQAYLELPLFSEESKWGFLISGTFTNNMEYENEGKEIKTYEVVSNVFLPRKYYFSQKLVEAKVGRSFGYKVKKNFWAGISFDEKTHRVYDGFNNLYLDAFTTNVMPANYKNNMFKLELKFYRHKYLKLKNFAYYDKIEDYSIGWSINAIIGLAYKFLGSDYNEQWFWLKLRRAWKVYNHIIEFDCSYDGVWREKNIVNGKLSFSYKHYIRKLPVGFLAFRVQANFGDNLETGKEFILGGANGLRAYPADKFEGDMSYLVNVEYRFDPINILGLNTGFVVFFDVGSAWESSEYDWGDAPVYPALGLGVRFSLPRLNPNIYRFDFAHSFGNVSFKKENYFSGGMSQVF